MSSVAVSLFIHSGECVCCSWALRSQVEGQFVEIHIAGDGSNLRAESCDLIGQHARSWDFDGIVPIVVVVAECVGEVQNSHLRDL